MYHSMSTPSNVHTCPVARLVIVLQVRHCWLFYGSVQSIEWIIVGCGCARSGILSEVSRGTSTTQATAPCRLRLLLPHLCSLEAIWSNPIHLGTEQDVLAASKTCYARTTASVIYHDPKTKPVAPCSQRGFWDTCGGI